MSLRDQFVFADRSGAIFTANIAAIRPGTTLAAANLERRDADFAPDQGAIERPVAILAGPSGALFILDADGDLFSVEAS